MYSQCPDCHTRFRVTAAHLRAAGGTVRCGRCGAAFDALLTLTDTLHAVEPEAVSEVAALASGTYHFSADDLERVFVDAREWHRQFDSSAAGIAVAGSDATGRQPVLDDAAVPGEEDITLEGRTLRIDLGESRRSFEQPAWADEFDEYDLDSTRPLPVLQSVPGGALFEDTVSEADAPAVGAVGGAVFAFPDGAAGELGVASLEDDTEFATTAASDVADGASTGAAIDAATGAAAETALDAAQQTTPSEEAPAWAVPTTAVDVELDAWRSTAAVDLDLEPTGSDRYVDVDVGLDPAHTAPGEIDVDLSPPSLESDAAGPSSMVAMQEMLEPTNFEPILIVPTAEPPALVGAAVLGPVTVTAAPLPITPLADAHGPLDEDVEGAIEREVARELGRAELEAILGASAGAGAEANVEAGVEAGVELAAGPAAEPLLAAVEPAPMTAERDVAMLPLSAQRWRRPVEELETAKQPSGAAARWGWGLATLLLALALAAQVAHQNRDQLARDPRVGATVREVYERLGQPLAERWDPTLYVLQQWGDAADAAVGTLHVRASITNKASFAQPAPLLRVALEDRYGNPVAVRDLRPVDYLADASKAEQPLAPGAILAVDLVLVDPGADAVGYQLKTCVADDATQLRCN